MNSVNAGEDISTPKTDEAKDSKNSTVSLDQNLVLNLMKKSISNSASNKRSSDQISKVSSFSDMRNNSITEGN